MFQTRTNLLGVAAFLVLLAHGAHATADVIAFDDAFHALGQGSDPNDFYDKPTFVGPFYGVVGGIGNGDPGNWGLEGTNGSAFWGFNNQVTGGLLFDTDVRVFSMDVSRSNGSAPGQSIAVYFFRRGEQVGSKEIVLGRINEWSTISFVETAIDEVRFEGSTRGFSPFGIDNIQYHAGPALQVTASCPQGGPIQISWSGATPRARVALLFGHRIGETMIPEPNACAGTALNLRGRVRMIFESPSGANGEATINADARPEACGGYLQLLDLSTCATSNVERIE